MKKILLGVIVIFLIFFGFIISIIARTNTDDNIPQQKKASTTRLFNVDNYLHSHHINPDSLLNQFPYDLYLDSSNIKNIKSIKKDLQVMDSFSKDQGINRQTLSKALTTKLAPRYNEYLKNYQPDSLLILVQWAEKFDSYANVDGDNAILYRSIYNYWLDTISNKLGFFSLEKPSLKYDFKFRYIRARCIEQRFVPAVKVTSEEKAINNLVYGTWGHFMRASWNQTNNFQKTIVLLFILLTLWGYACILQKLYRLRQKKRTTNE